MSLMGYAYPNSVVEKSEEKGGKRMDDGALGIIFFFHLILGNEKCSSILLSGMVKWRFIFS